MIYVVGLRLEAICSHDSEKVEVSLEDPPGLAWLHTSNLVLLGFLYLYSKLRHQTWSAYLHTWRRRACIHSTHVLGWPTGSGLVWQSTVALPRWAQGKLFQEASHKKNSSVQFKWWTKVNPLCPVRFGLSQSAMWREWTKVQVHTSRTSLLVSDS